MKKWLPFASLKEQAEYLRMMQIKRQKIERPMISKDTEIQINEILTNYSRGDLLNILYFERGFVKEIKTSIKRIDVIYQTLILEDKTINFENILNIEQV